MSIGESSWHVEDDAYNCTTAERVLGTGDPRISTMLTILAWHEFQTYHEGGPYSDVD